MCVSVEPCGLSTIAGIKIKFRNMGSRFHVKDLHVFAPDDFASADRACAVLVAYPENSRIPDWVLIILDRTAHDNSEHAVL
jgi:hypothetical protein